MAGYFTIKSKLAEKRPTQSVAAKEPTGDAVQARFVAFQEHLRSITLEQSLAELEAIEQQLFGKRVN